MHPSDVDGDFIYEDDFYIHLSIALTFPPPMEDQSINAVLSVLTQYNFAQIP